MVAKSARTYLAAAIKSRLTVSAATTGYGPVNYQQDCRVASYVSHHGEGPAAQRESHRREQPCDVHCMFYCYTVYQSGESRR